MSKFKFRAKAAKFKANEGQILDKMANEAVIEFKVNAFDKQGLDGNKWKPNQKQEGRQQLVKTGRMRQSIRILKKTAHTREVGSDVPYAEFHNEGTGRLPQRKFIGRSRALELRNKAILLRELKRIV